MRVSDAFSRQLDSEFGGQIRARWSPAYERFVIERKGARSRDLAPPSPGRKLDPNSRRLQALANEERWIQQRDGYYRVLEIAPGDRTPCRFCRTEIKLQRKSFKAPKCPTCQKEDMVMFVPLNDELLEVLRWSDPDRGGLERVEARDAATEARREPTNRRRLHNATEDIWKDQFSKIFGIQSVGYTGKEEAWNS